MFAAKYTYCSVFFFPLVLTGRVSAAKTNYSGLLVKSISILVSAEVAVYNCI